MKFFHNIILLCLIATFLNSNAQDFSDSWQPHFSYLSISDISESSTKVFAASENAIFIYDLLTFEIEEITTVQGLSGGTISTIHFSEPYEKLIIGYESGLIEIYDINDGEMLSVVDILEKPTIAADVKRINHFNEYENVIYISTDFGITVYDLENLEFGDTYFIGNGGSQIIVSETVVFNGFIYAACRSNSGIRKAPVDSDDLINFNVWNQIFPGNYIAINENGENFYTVQLSGRLYRIVNDTFTEIFQYPTAPLDIRLTDTNLLVTLPNIVQVYTNDFVQIDTVVPSANFFSPLTNAIMIGDDIYLGTDNNINQGKPGFGILKTNINDITTFEEIHPDGPLLNKVFSISSYNSELWATFGGYSITYNFNGGVRKTGLSHLKNESWRNIPFDTIVQNLDEEPLYLSHAAINPFNPNQVFVSSYWSGLVEMNNDESTLLYNETNSTISELVNVFNLTLSTYFDREGVLWVTNGRVDRPLNKFENGQWTSFDFTEIINPATSNLGFSDIVKDANGFIFVGTLNKGVIGFDEATGDLHNIFDLDQANLPDKAIEALAIDNNNQMWIGTIKGLRVLFNTSNFFEGNPITTNPIIILEDGIPKELLEAQFISDIKVDGANNKWISTIGAGVFFFTPDGQETIFHFTTDNSPLPSNNVNEIAIDDVTGSIYFATDRGLVSFRSGGSKPQETLDNAFVFPNPVRPTFNIVDEKVKIKDISENVNIKITDIEGNLVAEAQSNVNQRFKGYNLEIDGGTALWNGKNLANNVVASGVYLVMLSDLDTFETRVLKLMVVR